jgi:hypothetical protein
MIANWFASRKKDKSPSRPRSGPTKIRKKLGLKRGDLVAVVETPERIFITPQQVVATKALDSIGDILKK